MTEPAVRRTDEPADAEPTVDGLGWKDFATTLKTTAVGANVVLAAISTGLAVWTDGVGRWLLAGLVAASVLLFLGQLAVAWVRLRQRAWAQLAETRHQQELSEAREEVARATERAAAAAAELSGLQALRGRWSAAQAALHDLWLGYPAPYTDEVELTYLVGTDTEADRVVEHRRTVPDRGAALPFLQGRLTTPTQLDADGVTLADIELVTRSEDDRTAIGQIALTEKPGLLRCMFVFRPSITRPTSWYVRYRMPGLWDVLRDSGHDRLTWTPSARAGDPERSTLGRLVVNFDFPPEAGDDVFVRDRDNRELKRLTGPDGSLRYRWESADPLPEQYSWDLWWAMAP
ncbi:MAG TPA: hypothetical protein VGP36_18375 [Mycobacteriales bacterium]|nr:hypothetical protein [Mycobacteriales bacterium]